MKKWNKLNFIEKMTYMRFFKEEALNDNDYNIRREAEIYFKNINVKGHAISIEDVREQMLGFTSDDFNSISVPKD